MVNHHVTSCLSSMGHLYHGYPLVKVYMTNRKKPQCYKPMKTHNFDWAILQFAMYQKYPKMIRVFVKWK